MAAAFDISGDLDLTVTGTATANYTLSGGLLTVGGAINFGPGTVKTFDFTGGTLHVGTYNGDLANNGANSVAREFRWNNANYRRLYTILDGRTRN